MFDRGTPVSTADCLGSAASRRVSTAAAATTSAASAARSQHARTDATRTDSGSGMLHVIERSGGDRRKPCGDEAILFGPTTLTLAGE